MNIIGPDFLVFGVDDLTACVEYFIDYGLNVAEQNELGATLVALDGTGVILRHRDDPSLPPALATGSTLRQQVYGVKSAEVLDAIETELGKDRRVRVGIHPVSQLHARAPLVDEACHLAPPPA